MRLKRHLLRAELKIVAHPWLALALSAVVLVACCWLAATRLTISADQNKLFDPRVPFFRDYLHFVEAFPENEAVYVVVQQRDAGAATPAIARWTGIADAIAGRLRQMPDVVTSVDARVRVDEMGDQGLLFDDRAKVRASVDGVREFLPLVKVIAEKNTLRSLVLGGTPFERILSALGRAPANRETSGFASLLVDSWLYAAAHDGPLKPGAGLPDLAAQDATDPSRLGYYYVPDELDRTRHLLLVRVYPKTQLNSLTAISATIESIDRAVKDAAQPFGEFTVGLTGRPALDADEMRTTDRDTRRAEILAAAAVFVGLVVALRSFWLALAGEIALGVGIGWTFGWATLSLGELNLLSIVFLLALIGIGMDYLVQVLTRYRVEAARRTEPRRIWVAVFRHVASPINTACLGAASAFLVSALTEFRGAAELGILAGGGLILCLIAGYVVLPALLTIAPARRAKRPRLPPTPAVARSRRWRHLATPLAWCALLAAGLPYASNTRFNRDLLGLQSPDHESVRLVRHLQTWSAVVLSSDLDVLREVRNIVEIAPIVASTDSILPAYDNLERLRAWTKGLPTIAWATPRDVDARTLGSLAGKARDLATHVAPADPVAAESLRRFAAIASTRDAGERGRLAARLNGWQSGFLAQLRSDLATFHPADVNVDRLPEQLRTHLVSTSGKHALYIYPNTDAWEPGGLGAFARDVEMRVGLVQGAPPPTGIAINIYHSTASIERSFYQSTLYALVAIVLLVVIDLRHVGLTLLAISVLAFGLPMLVIVMGVWGVEWNFANFFALPILIGAGHEYGVFLVHRYVEARDDPRRAWGRWDVSDRAVALCAYVTCSSFGFFWLMASHRGLRSLGLVMTVGTACIYLASVLVLRPILKWRLEVVAARGSDRAAGPAIGRADRRPRIAARSPLRPRTRP